MTNLKTSIIAIIGLLTFTLISIDTNAQLHVAKKGGNVKNNGDVGIGTPLPTEKLDVDGNIRMRGGKLEIGGASKAGDNGKTSSRIKIGLNRPIDGLSYVDLMPKASEDWVGRFLANDEGVTTFSHQGAGHFQLRNFTSVHMRFAVTTPQGKPYQAITIAPNGNVGISMDEGEPAYRFHVNGGAAKPGGGSWINASDKRLKKNIENYDIGLTDVLKLNPVYYNYNGKGGISDTETRYVGLIAQDYQKVVPEAVSKFKHTQMIAQGEDKPYKTGKTEEYLAIDPSQITFMLVNGMKEQQALIEAQKAALETLKTEVAELKANGASISTPGASEMSVLLEGSGTENALLAQNSPNPFTTNTRIEYFIPSDSRHCRMSFRDMNGKELKEVQIENDGIGAIDLSAKDLAAGIYSYVLYVNGEIVASKKMILRQ